MFDYLLSLIAPHVCVVCQKEGDLLCRGCVQLIKPAVNQCYRCAKKLNKRHVCKRCQKHSPLYDLQVATGYAADVKELVHRFKYKRSKAAGRLIAKLMTPMLAGTTCALVTHVPTASRRVRIRGYDQSAIIARELAKQLNLSYRPLLLRDSQLRQVGQTRAVRKKQMQGAFRARQTIEATSIILVDDVLTTGSTTEAAAEALKRAGAEKITAAVFAARIK